MKRKALETVQSSYCFSCTCVRFETLKAATTNTVTVTQTGEQEGVPREGGHKLTFVLSSLSQYSLCCYDERDSKLSETVVST